MEKYLNRQQAGKTLAQELLDYADNPNVLILALPRGGVPIGFEIAKQLHTPLNVFIVRKLGIPGYEELAMGAIASNNIIYLNQNIINQLGINQADLAEVIQKENKELARREAAYRGHQPLHSLQDKIIILVDDGIATGATMAIAIKALRKLKPKNIIVAVPVAEKEISKEISSLVDKLVCPLHPEPFQAVGSWYHYFDQTSDEEVKTLLKKANEYLTGSKGV